MFRNGRVKGGGSVINRVETLTCTSQDEQLLYFYIELYIIIWVQTFNQGNNINDGYWISDILYWQDMASISSTIIW